MMPYAAVGMAVPPKEASMKWLIAAWLVLIVPVVHAVECGPLITDSRVKSLEKSLTDAIEVLDQHNKLLLDEISKLLASTPSEASLNQAGKINLESDLLLSAKSAGEIVQARLDALSTLVSIRDLMVDKRDKMFVEVQLSASVVFTKNLAEIAYKRANESLARLSRPGVAIDVSKLRDTIGVVSNEFQRCESPKLPSRRPATR